MDYFCAICKAEARVVEGNVVRTCDHHESTVIAERTAVLFGEGDAKAKTIEERIAAALGKLFRAFGVT